MIERHHIDRYKALIDSGLYAHKRAAADQVIDESPELQRAIGHRYKDLRSLYIVFNQWLERWYPGHAIEYIGRRGPYDVHPNEDQGTLDVPMLDGWTPQEKLDAVDLEVQEQNVRLSYQLQAAKDLNRIKDKSFRSQAREYNAQTAFNDALQLAIGRLPGCVVDFPTRQGALDPRKPVFIAQISDTHLNELIDMGDTNRFDFEIASRRLAKYVQFLKLQAKAFGAERVILAFGGDLLNSDRRIDERLSEATDRANACVIAAQIFYLMLMDLRADFFVDVLAVVGNEGRVDEKQSWSKKAAKYNYDLAVLKSVKQLVSVSNPDDAGLKFHLGEMGVNERTFRVNGFTFLILHGNQGRVAGGAQRNIQAVIGKYAVNKGKRVDKVLCGHIHSANAGDFFARNSSLAGSNDYSDSLQFLSKASQNLHVVTSNGDCYSMVVDLQNVNGIDGYEITDLLREFRVATATGTRLQPENKDDSHVELD